MRKVSQTGDDSMFTDDVILHVLSALISNAIAGHFMSNLPTINLIPRTSVLVLKLDRRPFLIIARLPGYKYWIVHGLGHFPQIK